MASHIIAFLIFLIISAYISCVNSAFLSQNDYSILTITGNDKTKLNYLVELIKKKDSILTSMLALNLMVNMIATIISTDFICDYLIQAPPDEMWDVLVSVFVSCTIIILFGEVTPAIIGNAKANSICYKSVWFLRFMDKLSKPFYGLIYGAKRIILSLIKEETLQLTHPTTVEEIKLIAVHGLEAGVIEDFGYKMISKAHFFNRMTADDLMMPINRVISLNENSDLNEIAEIFSKNMYSRMPVFNEDKSEIIGILNFKDICKYELNKNENFNIKEHLQETLFVHDTILIGNLFEKMRINKTQMAIIQNEYGVIVGLVTMFDIIERIFGKIDDEYEDNIQSRLIEKTKSKNEAVVDGSATLADLMNILKIEFDAEALSEFKTVNGFLVNMKGSFLVENEVLEYKNYSFKIEKVENQFAKSIRINENNSENKTNA